MNTAEPQPIPEVRDTQLAAPSVMIDEPFLFSEPLHSILHSLQGSSGVLFPIGVSIPLECVKNLSHYHYPSELG